MTEEYSGHQGKESGILTISTLLDDERVWLAVALLAGSIVVTSYYLMHPYPAYATALFPHMAEVLLENGYRRPKTIPYYTEGGIPFAYPPLMFYVMAVLIDLGSDPYQLVRLVPGIASVLALIPYFYLAREFLSVRQAGFATVMITVVPQAVRWHISGGGTVRGPAFLLVATGLYIGVRLFKTGERKWILPGAILYGLTMLTHPLYMAYFGLSYLVLYALFFHSFRGLVDGALVAAGGAIIGAPWWLYVSWTYGAETIVNASSTHGGLFSSEYEDILGSLLLFHYSSFPSELLIGFLVIAGAIYALSKRRYVLPIWFVVTDIFITQQRLAYISGAMLIAMAVAGAVIPWLTEVASGADGWDRSSRPVSDQSGRETITAVALVAVVLTTTWFGALYVTGDPPGEDRNAMSSYVDGDDIEAMEWAARETPPEAQFVVLGDAAEWFPYVAERTSLIGPWGVEWTTPDQYDYQQALNSELAACGDETCVTETITENDLNPDYVYVPIGEFTTGAAIHTQDKEMRRSMIESERYELTYANEGVMIFRVID